MHVCVYSLEPAGGGGVSWPVWDGGAGFSSILKKKGMERRLLSTV